MFTTPCFIRKNTPELRNKLKELGYIQVKQDIYYYHIMVENGNIWICNGAFNPDNPDGKGWDECIDCEDNEALFFALAALRDDSDYMQWFTNGTDFIKCEREDWPDMFSVLCSGRGKEYMNELDKYHKATSTEIIAHFKQEE